MAKKVARTTEMADYEVHVPLQAVLLADSFAQKFRPITLERPKVRFPMSTFLPFSHNFFLW
jgi:translation initiation factor eIF-2B subunit epsilon